MSSPSTAYIKTLNGIHPAALYSCFQLSCCDSLVFLFILYEDFYLLSDIIKSISTKGSRMQSQSAMWFTWCIMLGFVYIIVRHDRLALVYRQTYSIVGLDGVDV